MSSAKSAIGESKIKLPPLTINIVDGGEVVKVVEIRDPREAYCREFEISGGDLTAVPA